jgi:hypothetical protein
MAWWHKRDRAKERFWRRMLGQWRRSGQSIRGFCRQQGLHEPLFYAWRRTLAQRDQVRQRSRPVGRPHRPTPPADKDTPDAPPAFVPVHLVSSSVALEVILGPPCVVRVPAGFDPASLRQLLAVLHETPPC